MNQSESGEDRNPSRLDMDENADIGELSTRAPIQDSD